MSVEGKKVVVGQPESHQILRKADELKRMVIGCKRDWYADRDAWTSHQKLATAYKTLLITDLEFALDRKVEQELWNNCFKQYITNLQARTKDKRYRSEAQMTLAWFLDHSSGFYILLLQEVCSAFGLSTPFIGSGDPYGTWNHLTRQDVSPIGLPTKISCNYLCQHFLVHLGDIARYRGEDRQAETFYRHAISLSPSSGQPYNQIAILEASRGNKLSTVYFYVRAVSLRYPFPAASSNLSKVLGKLGGEGDQEKERTAKVTAVTFIPLFLRLHGHLHHANKLQSAVKISHLLAESLTNLVVGESLSTWQLIQVVVINIWSWSQGRDDQESDLTREERIVSGVVANLQAALLSACLLPVYTVQKGRNLLSYFALPVAKLVMDWVMSNPRVLHEHGFTSRAQIWPGLARLLNEAQPLLQDYDPGDMTSYPLPEDYDLQSFTPLSTTLDKVDMRSVSRSQPITDQDRLGLLRLHRLRETGLLLASLQPAVVRCNNDLWSATEVEWEDGEDPQLLVSEMDSLQLENVDSSEEEDTTPIWETPAEEKTRGILKNEKQTPSPLSSGSPSPSVNKVITKQNVRNVAMAAILKRAGMSDDDPVKIASQTEKKTVMFQTPSSGNSQTSPAVESVQSASQEDIPFTLLPNPPDPPRPGKGGARTWSPTPVLERPKVSVDQLDMSVPPPSLHSNYRPPALNSPGPAHTQPSTDVWGPQQTSPSHNPLLQLISNVERPGPGSFGGQSIFSQQTSGTSFYQPGPQQGPPANVWSAPQQEGQTYSLFSPSAWPGPLLSSPHRGQGGSPQRGGGQTTLPLFGENHSSPLERLLHQNKGADN